WVGSDIGSRSRLRFYPDELRERLERRGQISHSTGNSQLGDPRSRIGQRQNDRGAASRLTQLRFNEPARTEFIGEERKWIGRPRRDGARGEYAHAIDLHQVF